MSQFKSNYSIKAGPLEVALRRGHRSQISQQGVNEVAMQRETEKGGTQRESTKREVGREELQRVGKKKCLDYMVKSLWGERKPLSWRLQGRGQGMTAMPWNR